VKRKQIDAFLQRQISRFGEFSLQILHWINSPSSSQHYPASLLIWALVKRQSSLAIWLCVSVVGGLTVPDVAHESVIARTLVGTMIFGNFYLAMMWLTKYIPKWLCIILPAVHRDDAVVRYVILVMSLILLNILSPGILAPISSVDHHVHAGSQSAAAFLIIVWILNHCLAKINPSGPAVNPDHCGKSRTVPPGN